MNCFPLCYLLLLALLRRYYGGADFTTTLGASSVTTSPADGSTSGVSNTTDSKTTSSYKDFQTVTLHLKATVLSHNGENEDALLEALSKFLSQDLLKKNCTGCTVAIKYIKRT
ncbi:hypothetical protein EXN66_Car014995 [Channa argus]|uniref:Uncharacterized protein n=1 Tax=Channa argus TaxID=215402 RepID=A0A6G1QAK7_CHAAH|nr:hypothetical protein EXN66_Car014995 [Channa argus]